MTDHKSPTGLPLQPSRLGGSAHGGGGLPDDAVQIIAYDPSGGDIERAWRIKNLNDYVGGGAVVRGPFNFAFDTVGLAAGVDVYTPAIGEQLLDATIIVDTVFNGTTPKADIGTFVGTNDGLFKVLSSFGGLDLDVAAVESAGTGLLMSANSSIPGFLVGAAASGGTSPWGVFTAANPIKLVVSQDGTKGGAAVGGSAGAARLYIVTAKPVAL